MKISSFNSIEILERINMGKHEYSSIEQALEDLKNGKVILVTDDPDREK